MIGDKTPLAEEYAKLFLDRIPRLQLSEKLLNEELLIIDTLDNDLVAGIWVN